LVKPPCAKVNCVEDMGLGNQRHMKYDMLISD